MLTCKSICVCAFHLSMSGGHVKVTWAWTALPCAGHLASLTHHLIKCQECILTTSLFSTVHQTLWNCHWLSPIALLQNNFFAVTIWAWIKPCSSCLRSNCEHSHIVWENREKSSWMLEPFLSSIVCVLLEQ